ncbi:MAG: tetratricopeptide repeat protein [Planctomycetes bacterium]|jgi:tetratricopeptide (TPR) repeat protein|nr:tetratricopeptide repeat protein [Planctomycetota bacterium]
MVDLSKYLEQAADAAKRRNFAMAVKIYGQVLQIQPDFGEARAGLRKVLFQKVAQKPASKLGAVLLGGVHVLTGNLMKLCGQHGAAAKAYERYLVHDPLAEGTNLKLGAALQRAGLNRSALAVYAAYAEQQPRCLEACRAAGALYYGQGKVKEALAMYEQALKIDPRDQDSLKARKDLAAEGALRSSGIEQAQSSRELIKDKEQQRQLERQDRLQLSAEEIEAELTQVEEKLQAQPQDQKLLRRGARLREMAKDLPGALDLLEQLQRLQPGDGEVAELVGDLRIRLQQQMVQKAEKAGDPAAATRARTALQQLQVGEARRRVERNPTDLGARFELGSGLLSTGEVDAAIAELQQAVKDPRKKNEALFLLGRAFQQKNLPELALGQFDKALQAAGTGVLAKEALYEMGGICQSLGKRDDALRHYTRILEQDIGFRDVAKKVEQLKA